MKLIHDAFRIALIGLIPSAAFASTVLTDPKGTWLTEDGNSQITIELCEGKLCGKISWLEEPLNEDGSVKLDEQNRNPSLRNRPILGLPLLTGFTVESEGGEWSGGEIYNPENGKTYRSVLRVVDPNTLSVQGCVLIFCDGQNWTRVK